MSAFDLLAEGDLFGSIVAAFATGNVESSILYLILLVMACIFLYMKTREIIMVSLFLVGTGIVIMDYIDPLIQPYLWLVIVLGLSVALYDVLVRKD